MPDSAILSQFANVFRMSPQEVTEKIDADFNRYFGRYFRGEPFDAYVNHARAVIAETGWRGRVLDVGCGFGVFDICLKASGASSVTGADVVPEKVAGATRLVELMGVQSVDFREVTGEDLPFSEGEFDGVLIKDTVSHLPANTRCYAEAFRVLRPGGSMLIIDDRNGLAPRNRWRTQKLWELTESGAPEALARRGIRTNFTELRLRYIRDHFPELSDEACRKLAIETRGFLSSADRGFCQSPREWVKASGAIRAMHQSRERDDTGAPPQPVWPGKGAESDRFQDEDAAAAQVARRTECLSHGCQDALAGLHRGDCVFSDSRYASEMT